MSSTSCLWGGQLDQLPDGVRTSTTSRRSAGNAGAITWLIWRVALAAPRVSTTTSDGMIGIGSVATPSRPDRGARATTTVAGPPAGMRPTAIESDRPSGSQSADGRSSKTPSRPGSRHDPPSPSEIVTSPPAWTTRQVSCPVAAAIVRWELVDSWTV